MKRKAFTAEAIDEGVEYPTRQVQEEDPLGTGRTLNYEESNVHPFLPQPIDTRPNMGSREDSNSYAFLTFECDEFDRFLDHNGVGSFSSSTSPQAHADGDPRDGKIRLPISRDTTHASIATDNEVARDSLVQTPSFTTALSSFSRASRDALSIRGGVPPDHVINIDSSDIISQHPLPYASLALRQDYSDPSPHDDIGASEHDTRTQSALANNFEEWISECGREAFLKEMHQDSPAYGRLDLVQRAQRRRTALWRAVEAITPTLESSHNVPSETDESLSNSEDWVDVSDSEDRDGHTKLSLVQRAQTRFRTVRSKAMRAVRFAIPTNDSTETPQYSLISVDEVYWHQEGVNVYPIPTDFSHRSKSNFLQRARRRLQSARSKAERTLESATPANIPTNLSTQPHGTILVTIEEFADHSDGSYRPPRPPSHLPPPSLSPVPRPDLDTDPNMADLLFTHLDPRHPSHELRCDNTSVPFQQLHVSTNAISDALADWLPRGPDELLELLAQILGPAPMEESQGEPMPSPLGVTEDSACNGCSPSHQTLAKVSLEGLIGCGYDFGRIYAYMRPWWNSERSIPHIIRRMQQQKQGDMELRRQAVDGFTIANPHLPPRRVWDLISNRVVPFYILNTGDSSPSYIPPSIWAVSHAWQESLYHLSTPINGWEWEVPIPWGADLGALRIELLNLGAEYVFLDVLCLRQKRDPYHIVLQRRDELEKSEAKRRAEWSLDIPTIGWMYQHRPVQTVVIYFNGLGLPLNTKDAFTGSQQSWFNRVWTLQETVINWIPGGMTPESFTLDQTTDQSIISRIDTVLTTTPHFAESLDLLRSRYCRSKVDRVNCLAYLLHCNKLPLYDPNQSTEEAWDALVQVLPSRRRVHLLIGWSAPPSQIGRHSSWCPSWKMLGAEPDSDIPGPGFRNRSKAIYGSVYSNVDHGGDQAPGGDTASRPTNESPHFLRKSEQAVNDSYGFEFLRHGHMDGTNADCYRGFLLQHCKIIRKSSSTLPCWRAQDKEVDVADTDHLVIPARPRVQRDMIGGPIYATDHTIEPRVFHNSDAGGMWMGDCTAVGILGLRWWILSAGEPKKTIVGDKLMWKVVKLCVVEMPLKEDRERVRALSFGIPNAAINFA